MREHFKRFVILSSALISALPVVTMAQDNPAPTVQIDIDAAQPGKTISPDIIGIFFEDLNDAADGGLYAELLENRSFEFSKADNPRYHALTGWEILVNGQSRATVTVQSGSSLHANNPHYAVVNIEKSEGDDAAKLVNNGFGGLALNGGESYDFTFFASQLKDSARPTLVRLESNTGEVLAEQKLPAISKKWSKHSVTLEPKSDAVNARLVLQFSGAGSVAIDMVSLFPKKTFKNRPNGLRADLAQTIADIKPRFMRFPGGCLAHGRSLDSIYNWKETVGPVEQRKAKPNMWGYHQTMGLGYFEYFQFCEDIGAIPIPVLAAGVTCQFQGQKCIPMSDMPAYIKDVLDLVEYANGPATSTWGAKRAAAGHPQPFNLKYIALGNEDAITPEFRERFKMIYNEIKRKYPKMVVMGTSGPFLSGPDFDRGWELAEEMNMDMIDEHYYTSPSWFLNNNDYYDKHKRGTTKVYLGEYAAHEQQRRNTLRTALVEAAYLTGIERNGDIVTFASYAPLLGKIGRTQWNPNLIYFNNSKVFPTLNYEVQKLFSENSGDRYLPTSVKISTKPAAQFGTNLSLGTWNTQAEFDDVRIVQGDAGGFTDDFSSDDRANTKWSPRGGRWLVADGALRQSGNEQPALNLIEKPVADGDYVISLRARKTGGAEGFLIGFGGVDMDNFYWWNLGGWGNSRHAVEKSADGSKLEVGKSVPGQIETGRWYDIRIECKNREIRCFLDNKLVHEFQDSGFQSPPEFFSSAVRDSKTGDTIVKVVNAGPEAKNVELNLQGSPKLAPEVIKTVLSGPISAVNDFETKELIKPVTSSIKASDATRLEIPAHSLTILRMKSEKP